MTFDAFIPEVRLAFEYHGEQHFRDTMIYGLSAMYGSRDTEKRMACAEANITLVEVPYWWDDDQESLKTTIHLARPDLLPRPGKKPAIPKANPHNQKHLL